MRKKCKMSHIARIDQFMEMENWDLGLDDSEMTEATYWKVRYWLGGRTSSFSTTYQQTPLPTYNLDLPHLSVSIMMSKFIEICVLELFNVFKKSKLDLEKEVHGRRINKHLSVRTRSDDRSTKLNSQND